MPQNPRYKKAVKLAKHAEASMRAAYLDYLRALNKGGERYAETERVRFEYLATRSRRTRRLAKDIRRGKR